jgi:hypothetical protein
MLLTLTLETVCAPQARERIGAELRAKVEQLRREEEGGLTRLAAATMTATAFSRVIIWAEVEDAKAVMKQVRGVRGCCMYVDEDLVPNRLL